MADVNLCSFINMSDKNINEGDAEQDDRLPRPSPFGLIRRRVRRSLAVMPRAYTQLRAIGRPEATVNGHTELVVEGYPRSGNTFTELAIRASQPADLRLAHHSHAPAQVLRGVQLGVPTLVVIRAPKESVVSLVAQSPKYFDVGAALAEYNWFHKAILKVVDDVAVVPFEDVTSQFDGVISGLNGKFGMNLVGGSDYNKVERIAFELMNRRANSLGRDINGRGLSHRDRGTEKEVESRARAKKQLDSSVHRAALCEAENLYEFFFNRRLIK